MVIQKKHWFIVVILAVIPIILWTLVRQPSPVEFQVFRVHSQDDYLYKILRITPSSFKDRYRISELDRISNEVQLLNVTDKSSPTDMNFIVLKSGNKIQFIKAYPYMLNNESDTNFKNYSAKSIDINGFNTYIKHYTLSRRQIIEKYCYFLSAINFKNSYLILKEKSQADSLVNSKERMDSFIKHHPSANLIQSDQIQFNTSDDEVICWFIDKGVVKIRFEFSSSNLIRKADSDLVGFLGIESPSI